MKTKVFLMSLGDLSEGLAGSPQKAIQMALSCLWSCQQNESEELITARTINFTSVVIGDEVLSRAGGTSIDVISMRTELDDAFTVFNLREDTRSWEEFGKADEVLFYAHYPRLPEDVSGAETRVLKGGTDDYLFGQAKAVNGQQQVCLQFKRVMVPLAVEVLEEDGNPYPGSIEVGALLKNKGVQNLKDGSVTTLDEKEYTKFECVANSTTRGVKAIIAINLLPQKIEKGTPFQVQLSDGRAYTATVAETVLLKSGENYKAVVKGDKVTITIFDGSIPL